MDNAPAFFTAVFHPDRLKHAPTTVRAVTWEHVYMKRIQAKGTVVAVAAVCQGRNVSAAVGANEAEVSSLGGEAAR